MPALPLMAAFLAACSPWESGDLDGDGAAEDCDDADAAIHPGADDSVGDGIDSNCDGLDGEDGDGDGVASQESGGGDCDDADAAIHPGADELCDGIDNNCNGEADEAGAIDGAVWYSDGDGDGFGQEAEQHCAAPDGGLSSVDGDCDDADAAVHPDAEELCDGADNDCDGATDEVVSFFTDADGDGHGAPSTSTEAEVCAPPEGMVRSGEDCDDEDATTSPDAPELCLDGIDNDCDGWIDFCDPDTLPIQVHGAAVGMALGGAMDIADLTGDGIVDVLTTAQHTDSTGVLLLLAGPVSAATTLGLDAALLSSPDDGGGLGAALAPVDLDDDGQQDLLITDNLTREEQGTSWLFYGPLTAAAGLSDGIQLTAPEPLNRFTVADLDGDSVMDLLVGRHAALSSGRVWLLHGPITAAAHTDSAAVSMEGSGDKVQLAASITAEDLDGDGLADVALALGERTSGGAATALFLDGDIWAAHDEDDATVLLSHSGDRLSAVHPIGDQDGDGLTDLLITSPNDNVDSIADGQAWVVPGQTAWSSESISSLASLHLIGEQIYTRLGNSCDAEDLDGDGTPDLLLTAATGSGNVEVFRAMYLFWGGAHAGTISAAEADARLHREVTDIGGQISTGGDLSGDGMPDVLLSQPSYSDTAWDGGRLVLLEGGL